MQSYVEAITYLAFFERSPFLLLPLYSIIGGISEPLATIVNIAVADALPSSEAT